MPLGVGTSHVERIGLPEQGPLALIRGPAQAPNQDSNGGFAMHGYTSNLVGLGLILGAAVGYALGLALTDATTAAIFGAVGAGMGLVLGSAVGTARGGRRTS
jgi:hypothetical protein